MRSGSFEGLGSLFVCFSLLLFLSFSFVSFVLFWWLFSYEKKARGEV